MVHSYLCDIVEKFIEEDNEKLAALKRGLGEIEREINSLAQHQGAVLQEVVNRAKKLIERKAGHTFITDNWREIEHSLRNNLRALEDDE